MPGLVELIAALSARDAITVRRTLDAAPELVVACVARADEHFVEARHTQVYAGDTALHAAAFSHDPPMVELLLEMGADVRAPNRRRAQPMHAAATGMPGSPSWDPAGQCEVIEQLARSGADIDAAASGGVTPLHRAVRNRCAAAVETLLRAGADPNRPTDRGSTAWDLAQHTTGRSGSGSPAARAEQERVIALLDLRRG